MDNGEVTCDGMVIDKADEKNEYTYSQCAPSTLDILIKALDCANDNLGIDVLQHDNDVDRFIVELNHHPTIDIHVEPIHHKEEHEAKYSLDEMKLIDKEEKLIHESSKSQYFNVVKDDYKPCLASVFSNVKPKRKKCGVERNYVLRSVKERKKGLAMSLHSLYGQQVTTTPSPPKTRSQSVNGDYIAAPEFEEDVSEAPKIRPINELMTLEVFVEQLSRPHNFKKEKVTLPDGFAEFLKMQDPPEYQFPWGYQDIAVTRAFWLGLACLDPAKDGWFHDCHLDLWVDLMWYFRDPDADWAMVSPHFLPSIPGGSMRDYFFNGVRYPVAWRDVEKVYFPVNEPKKHWCLAELHISTGVVTFYDALESKGISVESYEIKYMFPKVFEQADLYGDCGV
ncbi:phospholipase-like protein [Tanacetum coccineum]